MLRGVPAETTAGETRVAITPQTAQKPIAPGHTVPVQSSVSATDEAHTGSKRLCPR